MVLEISNDNTISIDSWLVVWTPLKNMKVNWDDDIPNIWENKIDGNQTTKQLSITGMVGI